jgi:hypothetical protein
MLSQMIRYLQKLFFDPGGGDALAELAGARPSSRKPGQREPLTPEEREHRRRLRERLRRRQKWLLPDAKPKKPRKPKRRKRRKVRARRPPRYAYQPQMLLDEVEADGADGTESADGTDASGKKRHYKPLASPLYNLPAGLVDDIAKLDLRRNKQLRFAKLLVEQFQFDPEDGDVEDQRREALAFLEQAALRCPKVPLELQLIREQWERGKETLHKEWSKNHERKANCYYLPPLVYEPQHFDNVNETSRDTFE